MWWLVWVDNQWWRIDSGYCPLQDGSTIPSINLLPGNLSLFMKDFLVLCGKSRYFSMWLQPESSYTLTPSFCLPHFYSPQPMSRAKATWKFTKKYPTFSTSSNWRVSWSNEARLLYLKEERGEQQGKRSRFVVYFSFILLNLIIARDHQQSFSILIFFLYTLTNNTTSWWWILVDT